LRSAADRVGSLTDTGVAVRRSAGLFGREAGTFE